MGLVHDEIVVDQGCDQSNAIGASVDNKTADYKPITLCVNHSGSSSFGHNLLPHVDMMHFEILCRNASVDKSALAGICASSLKGSPEGDSVINPCAALENSGEVARALVCDFKSPSEQVNITDNISCTQIILVLQDLNVHWISSLPTSSFSHILIPKPVSKADRSVNNLSIAPAKIRDSRTRKCSCVLE